MYDLDPRTCKCVMGTEAELTVLSDNAQTAYETRVNAHMVIEMVKQIAPTVDDANGGVFVPAGRIYVDGEYLELATAECSSPWETVSTLRTLESLVECGRQRLAKLGEGVSGICGANTHTTVGTTAGMHDNHAAAKDKAPLTQLLPHLASQVIYTGAGGLDPLHPGIVPILSPRRRLLVRRQSRTRPTSLLAPRESHDSSTVRVHATGGEHLCFDRGLVLRLGTTALVLKLLENGRRPGYGTKLARVKDTVDVFARSCDITAQLACGRTATATWIQRRYLTAVASHLHEDYMPEWAEEIVQLWHEALCRLEGNATDDGQAPWFDWEAKERLFAVHLRQSEIPPPQVRRWNVVLGQLGRVATQFFGERPDEDLLVELVHSPCGKLREAIHEIRRLADAQGLSIWRVGDFLRLRNELLELELRFCILGETGLAQRVPHERYHHAYAGTPLTDPLRIASVGPVIPRAQSRAELIQNVTHQRSRYTCDWSGLNGSTRDQSVPLLDVRSLDAGAPKARPGSRSRVPWL